MNHLSQLTTTESIYTVVAVIFMAFLAFKLVSMVIKMVVTVAIVALLAMFVFKPAMLRGDIVDNVARTSPEARYAVETFAKCFTPGVSPNNVASECKSRVIQFAEQHNGHGYALKAGEAIDSLLLQFKNNKLISELPKDLTK